MAIQTTNKLGEMSFTVDDYYKMIELGILPENNKTEIIDGKLIDFMPIGSKHAGCINRLSERMRDLTRNEFIVSVQNPVRLNNKQEPIPDIALLTRREDFYTESHPSPKDVLLLVEVSDSTIQFDRDTKIPIYAEAKIPEVWIVNLQRSIIEIYTKPRKKAFNLIKVLQRGETLKSETVPNLSLKVDMILG